MDKRAVNSLGIRELAAELWLPFPFSRFLSVLAKSCLIALAFFLFLTLHVSTISFPSCQTGSDAAAGTKKIASQPLLEASAELRAILSYI